MKIAIVDDEPKAAEVLETLLVQYFPNEIQNIKIFNDPQSALISVTAKPPDLLFLDIKMPKMDGMSFIKQMSNASIKVIFVTAYSTFAIEALRENAFDYLVKPVDEEDLIAAIDRFKKSSHLKPETIKMRSGEVDVFASVKHIIRAEGFSNYTKIFRDNGKSILTAKTLKEYEKLLKPFGFLRTHKSHLVNPAFLHSISKNAVIILKNGDLIPIAKRRRKVIKEALHELLLESRY
ncbi:LytR/AlgR family response regulator transcription factor [Portibacter marinus]|uniref:LytR/AlgR family response regulator transcription factor n=1 Tax=Portibacter marinus TaxID=2898660 RepID=UPI001F44B90B|nr:LytTR family DNA-binding domain-containing protein [Portibacter marinus]